MVINCDRQEIILHSEILLQNALKKKMCMSVLYVCVSVHHVRLVATEAKEGISTHRRNIITEIQEI